MVRPRVETVWENPSEGASGNGSGGGFMADIPSAISGRFRYLRDLVPPTPVRRVILCERITDGAQTVLKLVSERQRLAALTGAPRDIPSALVLPYEKGNLADRNYPFYEIQPFQPGEGLASWLLRKGQLSGGQVQELADQLLDLVLALADQSSEGRQVWVHCDLKPSNLIVVTESPLRLAAVDFGEATCVSNLSVRYVRGRTIAYSGPELAHGQAFQNSDLWSVGMIAYEAMLGRHPMAVTPEADLSSSVFESACRTHLANRWEPELSPPIETSIGVLLTGLLTNAPSERLQLSDVRAYRRGSQPLPDTRARQRAISAEATDPFAFMGKSYFSLEALTAALLANWIDGEAAIGTEALPLWIRDTLHRPDLSNLLIDPSTLSPAEKLVQLVYRVSPGLPPIWRGLSLARGDLTAVACAGLNQSQGTEPAIPPELQSVLGQVGALRFAVPDDHCGPIARLWNELEDALGQAWREVYVARAPKSSFSDSSNIRALALLLACEPDRIRLLRDEVQQSFVDNVPREAWYHSFGDDASRLTPAQVCVLRSLLPLSSALLRTELISPLRQPSQSETVPVDTEAPEAAPLIPQHTVTLRYALQHGRVLM